MQEEEQKSPANRFETACEIVSLGILAIAVYVGAIWLLGEPINRHMPVWFSGSAGPLMILGVDIAWIFGIKLRKSKTKRMSRVKRFLSVLIFSLSASVLTSWLILNLLSDIW